MTDLFKRYATPLITGFFLISLVSGTALFLHLGQAAFREMHEWLSIVLILPFALHLWKNWRSMLNYVGRVPFTVASVVSLVAALAFAYPALTGTTSGERGGPPQFAFADMVLKNAAKDVAPALGKNTETIVADLAAAGFTAAAADKSLSEIATQSGKTEVELMATLAK